MEITKENQLKILLVEDDEEDYILTKELLLQSKNIKYELIWTQSYPDAFELIKREEFDIVLVDYRLGEYNGLELLQDIVQIDDCIPVILLTGLGDDEVDLLAMKYGASDYLVKGEINSTILERSIRYSIESKKKEEEIIKLNEELERRVIKRTLELEEANTELQKEIEERKKAEEKIYKMAYYDNLTELPNRVMLQIGLNKAIEEVEKTACSVGVMFIDLDGFKSINDTFGHEAGDKVLKSVDKLLKQSVRESDIVSRHGGDEFIVILKSLCNHEDATKVADKILSTLSQPILIDENHISVTPSIGIAIYPDHGTDTNKLMHFADKAMYISKTSGKNMYKIFDATVESLGS